MSWNGHGKTGETRSAVRVEISKQAHGSPRHRHPSESASFKALNYRHSLRAPVSMVLTDSTHTLVSCVLRRKINTVIHRWNIHACMCLCAFCKASVKNALASGVCSKLVKCSMGGNEAESYCEVRGFPLNHFKNTVLSSAIWVLKQQFQMRLVFVSLYQNS